MKKKLALALATMMTTTAVAIPTMANTQTAYLRSDISIVIDGKDVDFKTASGTAVYPMIFENSTYLPLRAIGEVMGKNVNWDETTKTVTLSGTRTTTSTNTQNPNIGTQKVNVQERADFTIVVDGVQQNFTSATGETIYPVLYNGSTYIPLRSIGTLMNRQVSWDATTATVTLAQTTGSTVTDADSFNTTTPNTGTTSTTTDIGAEKAKQIALQHAGKSASEVVFVWAKADFENGKKVYDVEFYSGSVEYDYEIEATTGTILSYDTDAEYYTPPTTSTTDIGAEKAKQIALQHAGKSASEVVFVIAQADFDDGRKVYDVEFYSGNVEYDYEIEATTGKILSYDADAEYYTPPTTTTPSTNTAVTLEQAKQIALQHAGVSASEAAFTKSKLDYDDGVQKYELEFRVGRVEYECEVHAQTGVITDYDVDYD